MSAPPAFPWDEVMRFCLGILRWSPAEFWRSTPREVAAAFEAFTGGRGAAPALGTDLARLMDRFPD
ncbi:phage tail assembly chaperone [Microvirga rosea]|uniref:phage tail assembly chaperone n=1 Tax=Microvirga rosea TaxID=2715425 RepID=UPI001D0A649C|nr:phage tail assembly chaperone [Microvirga rosea]MCB8820053.1 phage tail assembly chaperone [Microvirga rosea]